VRDTRLIEGCTLLEDEDEDINIKVGLQIPKLQLMNAVVNRQHIHVGYSAIYVIIIIIIIIINWYTSLVQRSLILYRRYCQSCVCLMSVNAMFAEFICPISVKFGVFIGSMVYLCGM